MFNKSRGADKLQERKVEKILEILADRYPVPKTTLNFSSPFELLIATIMSAQTTDKQVNRITKELFKDYNRPEDFYKMKQEELEEKICSIGLYHNKSKYIIETSKIILTDYQGQVPDTREELMKLPGVGRKTANVLLVCAFGINTIPVDTHVFRVANRIGLADSENVVGVEKQLQDKISENLWGDLHHWLIFLGRDICKARRPNCKVCPINYLCEYYKKVGNNKNEE